MKANDKIRAGIIGIGNWGRYGHVPVIQLLPKFELVAVASRRQEAARQLAREFSIADAFADADELIHHFRRRPDHRPAAGSTARSLCPCRHRGGEECLL